MSGINFPEPVYSPTDFLEPVFFSDQFSMVTFFSKTNFVGNFFSFSGEVFLKIVRKIRLVRAHRIGRVSTLNIEYLIAKGTADDWIWNLIQRKLETLDDAGLGGSAAIHGEHTYANESR